MKKPLLCLAVLLTLPAGHAEAYVDQMSGFTLGYVVERSPVIVVVRVEKVSLEKRAIIFKKVADLKGRHPTEQIKHQLQEGLQPQELKTILDWAEPGRIAVCFHDGKVCQTCIGRYWYQCTATQEPWWTMTHGQGHLCLAYCGPVQKLPGHVSAMLQGRVTVVTALQRDISNPRAREAIFRNVLRGKDFPVWRVKASLGMPAVAYLLADDQVVGMGAGGRADVAPLVDAIRGGDRLVRREAAEELGLIGPAANAAVPALREACRDSDGRVRVSATLALAQIDPKEDPMPVLAASLKDGDAVVRAAAATALGRLRARASTAVAALTPAVEDADITVRWAAVDALAQYGFEARATVPLLLKALKEEHASLRAVAAQALGDVCPAGDAQVAIAPLAEALRDGDRQVRRQAAWSLAKLGGEGQPHAKAVVQVLTDGLTDPWEWGATLAVLVRLRSDSVPALVEALQRGDVEVRKAAANLFLQLRPDEYQSALPALIEALKDTDSYVRFRVAFALIQSGPEAKAALGPLNDMLKEEDRTNRLWAAVAVGLIGKEQKVVPLLLEGLQVQTDASLRRYAAQALGAIGAEARPAVPALTEALRDQEETVRTAAAEALKSIRQK